MPGTLCTEALTGGPFLYTSALDFRPTGGAPLAPSTLRQSAAAAAPPGDPRCRGGVGCRPWRRTRRARTPERHPPGREPRPGQRQLSSGIQRLSCSSALSRQRPGPPGPQIDLIYAYYKNASPSPRRPGDQFIRENPTHPAWTRVLHQGSCISNLAPTGWSATFKADSPSGRRRGAQVFQASRSCSAVPEESVRRRTPGNGWCTCARLADYECVPATHEPRRLRGRLESCPAD